MKIKGKKRHLEKSPKNLTYITIWSSSIFAKSTNTHPRESSLTPSFSSSSLTGFDVLRLFHSLFCVSTFSSIIHSLILNSTASITAFQISLHIFSSTLSTSQSFPLTAIIITFPNTIYLIRGQPPALSMKMKILNAGHGVPLGLKRSFLSPPATFYFN